MKPWLKLFALIFAGIIALYALMYIGAVQTGYGHTITVERVIKPWGEFGEFVLEPTLWLLKTWWNVWFGDEGNHFSRWLESVHDIITNFWFLPIAGFALAFGFAYGAFDATIGIGAFVAFALAGHITFPLAILLGIASRIWKKRPKKDEKKKDDKKPAAKKAS